MLDKHSYCNCNYVIGAQLMCSLQHQVLIWQHSGKGSVPIGRSSKPACEILGLPLIYLTKALQEIQRRSAMLNV